jgi:hypothetical protein
MPQTSTAKDENCRTLNVWGTSLYALQRTYLKPQNIVLLVENAKLEALFLRLREQSTLLSDNGNFKGDFMHGMMFSVRRR